ncbi:MAG: hypothetical protein JW839_13880 [Candidatus Lokiarchaeota archaeon]|nr:hypothetical protein [Candidatus Lokiarchaeota archaeon]
MEKVETQPDIDALERKYKGIDPWNQVGFTRTLGGFFYRYVLFLVGASDAHREALELMEIRSQNEERNNRTA